MKYFFLILLLLILNTCKKDPLEKEILKFSKQGDFLKVAALCSEYKGEKFKKECEKSFRETEKEIDRILASYSELPFFKMMLDKEKKEKIQEVLKKNVYMGIKYRKIWNETVERD
jgi:hypothetical protein